MKSENKLHFLSNGGKMGELIRSYNWSATPIGSIENWDHSLRTTIGILLHSAIPMVLYWGEDYLCFYNDALIPSMGINGDDPPVGKKAKELWTDVWDFICPLLEKVMTTGDAISLQDQLIPLHRNDKIVYVYWTLNYSPVFGDDGGVKGVFLNCTETTEKIQNVKRLEESERKVRLMIRQAPVAMAIFHSETHFVEMVNSRALELLGRKEEEVINKPILEAIPELKTQGIKAILDDVYNSGKSFEANEWPLQIFRNEVLTDVYINFVCEALYDSEGNINGIMAVGYEVTDQVIARKKIKENEHKLNIIIDSSELGVYEWSFENNIANYSKRSLEIFGYPTDSTINLFDLRKHLHPDDLQIRDAAVAVALEHGTLDFTVRIIWDDNTTHWIENKGKVFYNIEKKPIKLIGTIRDITQTKKFAEELEQQVSMRTKELGQKNIELKKMNDELESFVYVASHDLQEPIRKIQTFSNIIIDNEHESLSEKAKDYFFRMKRSANRMQQLIDDLLVYSHTNAVEHLLMNIDLTEIIEEVLFDIEELIIEKNAIVTINCPNKIFVIPFQFKQVINNLVNNSLTYSKPDVTPLIEITSKLIKGAELEEGLLVADKTYCHISFSDNGIGFEPEYKDKIFEVFQRLHRRDEYKGTGIGLAIVKKIILNHNGLIVATGQSGVGASFDIYLPVL